MERLLETPAATYLCVLVALWALLGDDLRIISVRSQADVFFLPGTIVCIAFFALETSAQRPLFAFRLSSLLTPPQRCCRWRGPSTS